MGVGFCASIFINSAIAALVAIVEYEA